MKKKAEEMVCECQYGAPHCPEVPGMLEKKLPYEAELQGTLRTQIKKVKGIIGYHLSQGSLVLKLVQFRSVVSDSRGL